MTAPKPAPEKESAPVLTLKARKHSWGDPKYIHPDSTPSGCRETEKACRNCGLIKITVHPPEGPGNGYPYPAWRTKGGTRFPDNGLTPLCEGVA
jgi:hypothetical protein